jgi:hypothetical protein
MIRYALMATVPAPAHRRMRRHVEAAVAAALACEAATRFVHRIGSRTILLVGTLAMLGSGAAMLASGLGGIAGIVGPMVVYVMGIS